MSAFSLSCKMSRYLAVVLCVCQGTLISKHQQAKRWVPWPACKTCLLNLAWAHSSLSRTVLAGDVKQNLKKKQKKNTSPVDMKGADRTASALLKHVLYNVINSSVAQSLSELAIKCTKKAIMEVEKKKRHDMERKHSFNCAILVHL